jgi:hypothetical protein
MSIHESTSILDTWIIENLMAPSSDEIRGITETARDLALRQLDQQLSASDNLDAKALGLLGIDIAALAAILAAIKDVFQSRPWQVPAVVVMLAAIFAMAAIATRRWDYGPEVGAFYEKVTSGDNVTAANANADLISELVDPKKGSLAKGTRKVRWKARLFMISIGLTLLAALLSAIILA